MSNKLKLEFTSKELNYIEMALMERVRSLESGPLRDAGNMPYLRRFSLRLLNKIRRLRGYPVFRRRQAKKH